MDMSNLTCGGVGVDTSSQRPGGMELLQEGEGEENNLDTLGCSELHGTVSPARSACVSPASSNGGVYSVSRN